MTGKILVTGSSVRADLLKPLLDAGYTVDNPTGVLSEAELQEALADAEGYLFGGDEFASGEALSRADQLKVIAFLGVGYESFVDAKVATERGVLITNTPGTLVNSVAEFTIGHLLNATRKLVLYAGLYAAGQSGEEEKQHDVVSQHVGIVGLGAIGTRIAEILRQGFGARVSYFSRTRKPESEARLGLNFAPLLDLASAVDALIVMTPGNDATRSLIDRSLVEAAKPGLLVINTARAEVVDPEALLYGLQSGAIGYGSFDGFYADDAPGLAALKAFIPSRLTVTGHIASLTHEARDGMAVKATQSILNVLTHGTDDYIVNSPRSK